jgi:hypothetical protein
MFHEVNLIEILFIAGNKKDGHKGKELNPFPLFN